MWIPLIALLVATVHIDAPQSATAKTSKSRPLTHKAPARAGAAFESLSEPALRKALLAMGEPVALTTKESKALKTVVAKLRAGDEASARKAWATVLKLRGPKTTPDDVAALIGLVMHESYMANQEDLRFYAEKVQFYNELKKALRDHIKDTRERTATAKTKGLDQLTVTTVLVRSEFKPGRRAVLARDKRTLSLHQAEALLSRSKAQLSTLGEDAQMSNLDLQSALQKQQRTLQAMINVSKMFHDTATSIICKMAGTC